MKHLLLLIVTLISINGFAQKTASNASIDSLPQSEIDIPIQINLVPLFALADKKVDTAFTSPNYPNDWIQSDCSTRYKYHFRRSPLKISMNGTTMNLSFMGYYQIVGSTRVCVNGTVLSPWTPGCRCGFDEPERRVNIGFVSNFKLEPNYILTTTIRRTEPQALDKCSVCFWGQDITTEVMKGLKADLDESRKSMEASFSFINLRPYIQQAWNKMSDVYSIPNVGYFTLHPKRLRMENINVKNNLLNINIGISATPVISFAKPEQEIINVPDLTPANNPGGFNIYLEAALQYDSLSTVMNNYMANKRFDLSQGFIKNHIIIQKTSLAGTPEGNLKITVEFTGSFDGTAFFTGKPVYNAEKKLIEVQNLDYDLQTKNLFLKTAKWLFSSKITSELKKYSSIDLSSYYDTASKTLNSWLNKEWTKGITGSGSITDLKLTAVHALPEHLLIRSNCVGKLNVLVSEIQMNF
ncbi:MAG TPA: DUF4403 family protein [Flavisolibacter sp.]|nr:DUF4403 family protein [Flavisolibacter sp.]